jgi:hypothetical protein
LTLVRCRVSSIEENIPVRYADGASWNSMVRSRYSHAADGLIAAGGITGGMAVWNDGQSEPVLKFRASP